MYDNKTYVCPDRIVNIYQPLELILADQKYLTRENRAWLKEREIRIVGKP